MEQIALVTGGGSGIGRSMVHYLNKNNFIVYIVGRRLSKLEETASLAITPDKIKCFSGDVTQSETAERIAKTIKEQHGRLDYLINNAGLGFGGMITDISPDEIRNQIDVNLIAPILLTRTLLPLLDQSTQPKIFNISSMAAKVHLPYHSVYAASKSGLSAFTKTLRYDLDEKYMVFDVTPGLVRSEMASDKTIEKMKAVGMPVSPLETDHAAEILFSKAKKGKLDIVVASKQDQIVLKLNSIVPGFLRNRLNKEKLKMREIFNFANEQFRD